MNTWLKNQYGEMWSSARQMEMGNQTATHSCCASIEIRGICASGVVVIVNGVVVVAVVV